MNEITPRELLDRFEKPLVVYAEKLTGGDLEAARDIVQEAFLRLLKDPQARELERPVAWLYRVVRNLALDRLRKEKRMSPLTDLTSKSMPDPAPLPDRRVELKEVSQSIMAAMAALSSRNQEVLRLKFQAGLSYREIGEVTGDSVSNVGFIIHQSLKALRAAVAPARK